MSGYIRFIGIPHSNMDCWELCQYFYREVFFKELPNIYLKAPKGEECISIVNAERNILQKVLSPEFGDIVLMNIGGYPSHVGIYLGEGKVLQTFQKTGSAIHSLRKWEKTILGYYRWPN